MGRGKNEEGEGRRDGGKSASLSLGPRSKPSGLVMWTEEQTLSREGGASEDEPGIHTAWGFLGRSLQTDQGCLSVVYFFTLLFSTAEEEVVVTLWLVDGVRESI